MNSGNEVNRRTSMRISTGLLLFGSSRLALPAMGSSIEPLQSSKGVLIGEPTAERVAEKIFIQGGNVVDAIVAGALAAAVAAPHQTGIGGYGASGMVALHGGKTILALDANSMAPAAMTTDMFHAAPGRKPPDRNFGWKAAGVPGILAGLQLLLDRFGTKPLSELLQPAILLCRQGFRWPANVAKMVSDGAARFGADPGSRKIYFRDGKPLAAGDLYTNVELAELLEQLAKANSVSPFYRGDIAQRIADAFQANDGLVTRKDLEEYQPRLIEPLSMAFGSQRVFTAPLTAGGLTVLQTLRALDTLRWTEISEGTERWMTQIEAMRLAWRDRLNQLGDPDHSQIDVAKLLSREYASESAELVRAAVRNRKPIPHAIRATEQTGTIHLSAVDHEGNFVALTLTHGGGFGARVTVDGLGLTLGHGMSRFDPQPDHPNSPGPRKRPLHNMVPTIVAKEGKPVLALGGRGGRKIPNAMLEFLLHYVLEGASQKESMRAPRIHTEGNDAIQFEPSYPQAAYTAIGSTGYRVSKGSSATLSSVEMLDSMESSMR